MTIVREMDSAVATLLGVQEINESTEYRRLSFCITKTIDGAVVAYNALTGEIAELAEEEAKVLRAETVSPTLPSRALIEKWFLVPSDHDDIRLYQELSDFLKLFEKSDGIINYTIFTTMDCNARCFYCYEMGRPRTPMSLQTAKDVVAFIEKNAPKDKKIKISWFGGEPLYNADVIDVITDGLDAAGITYTAHMTSNGYLFDADTAKKAAKKWNVKTVQITLDGTEEVYNKAKAYIHSEGVNPFYRVTDNIEHLLKNDIRVSVRMNMGAHNQQDLYQLVDWLAERYKGYNKFGVYAHLLFEIDPKKVLQENRWLLSQALAELEAYCLQKKLLTVSSLPKKMKSNRCMADSPVAITILPNGNLGKCEHFSEDEFVGTIYDGITNTQKVAEFCERANSAEMCAGCPAYPKCIRLKKCPDIVSDICDAGTRAHEEQKMLRELAKTYRKLKEQQKEGSI